MAYALGEVAPRDRLRAVERAWLNATQALVLIEPGTTAGFQRILDARRVLVARGAHLAAPCPHAGVARWRRPTGATSRSAWNVRAACGRSSTPTSDTRTKPSVT